MDPSDAPTNHPDRRRRRPRAALAVALAVLAAGTSLVVASRPSGADTTARPYAPGVAANLSDAIRAGDPSVTPQQTYAGLLSRTVIDRRHNGPVTIKAYVWKLMWPDGQKSEVIVNAEFGSKAAAEQAKAHFLPMVGQLPTCLRAFLDTIVIHKANEPFSGGSNSLLLYSERPHGNEIQEILVHEAAHNLGQRIQTSARWNTAQRQDKAHDPNGYGFISVYARKFPSREDVSESFLAWLVLRRHADRLQAADRTFIRTQIPNRLGYFDHMGCSTYPVG